MRRPLSTIAAAGSSPGGSIPRMRLSWAIVFLEGRPTTGSSDAGDLENQILGDVHQHLRTAIGPDPDRGLAPTTVLLLWIIQPGLDRAHRAGREEGAVGR